MLATLMVTAATICGPGMPERPLEIRANHWFNSFTIRVPENRSYVLMFFSTVQGKEETKRYLSRLSRIQHAGEVVVVGLSAESSKRVGAFVTKHKIQFPVGAESRDYKRFGIKRFPAIVFIDGGNQRHRGKLPVWSIDQLEDYVNLPHAGSALDSSDFDADSSLESLVEHTRRNPDDMARRRALTLLRDQMEVGAFMALCDELLESAEEMTLRGNIAYQRHLANPNEPLKEARVSPSTLARRARRETIGGAEWQRIRDYEANATGLSQDQLVADFFDNQDREMDSEGLLIRREIASRFNSIAEDGTVEEKRAAKSNLMKILPGEPDAAIRLWLVGALWSTTAPGDLAVADFLTEQLQSEPNIRSVRPMMETVIRCMRTGEGPCDNE